MLLICPACANDACPTSVPRITGKERDAETGLDYFGARYFSAAQGRWTSPDVINVTKTRLLSPANTLNKYVYGANNPLKYVDPNGQDITIFYRRGNTANPADSGHVFAAVLNQKTGQVLNPTDFAVDFTSNAVGHGLVKAAESVVNKTAGGAVETLSRQAERAQTPTRQAKVETRLSKAVSALESKKQASAATTDTAREAVVRQQQKKRSCNGTLGCQY